MWNKQITVQQIKKQLLESPFIFPLKITCCKRDSIFLCYLHCPLSNKLNLSYFVLIAHCQYFDVLDILASAITYCWQLNSGEPFIMEAVRKSIGRLWIFFRDQGITINHNKSKRLKGSLCHSLILQGNVSVNKVWTKCIRKWDN